jgi:hypothetical protein
MAPHWLDRLTMADKPQRISMIRDWVQPVVVVAAFLAGIWQFQVKEYWNPAAAPLNLSMDVTLKEAGFSPGKGNEPFEAIELAITAKNPSTLDLYLLASCWDAKGFAISNRNESEDWAKTIKIEEDTEISHPGTFYKLDRSRVMAAGRVFKDSILHPNESISTSFVFYVPQDVYDILSVQIMLPTAAVRNADKEPEAEAVWTVTPEGCVMQAFRKLNGLRREEITDNNKEVSRLKLQLAKSTRELSLWQSKPPPAAPAKPPIIKPKAKEGGGP